MTPFCPTHYPFHPCLLQLTNPAHACPPLPTTPATPAHMFRCSARLRRRVMPQLACPSRCGRACSTRQLQARSMRWSTAAPCWQASVPGVVACYGARGGPGTGCSSTCSTLRRGVAGTGCSSTCSTLRCGVAGTGCSSTCSTLRRGVAGTGCSSTRRCVGALQGGTCTCCPLWGAPHQLHLLFLDQLRHALPLSLTDPLPTCAQFSLLTSYCSLRSLLAVIAYLPQPVMQPGQKCWPLAPAPTARRAAAEYILPLLDAACFKGVCFYSSKHRGWMMLEARGRCLTLAASPVAERQAFAIFDDARWVGGVLWQGSRRLPSLMTRGGWGCLWGAGRGKEQLLSLP